MGRDRGAGDGGGWAIVHPDPQQVDVCVRLEPNHPDFTFQGAILSNGSSNGWAGTSPYERGRADTSNPRNPW